MAWPARGGIAGWPAGFFITLDPSFAAELKPNECIHKSICKTIHGLLAI
jgi:hypothetical protein